MLASHLDDLLGAIIKRAQELQDKGVLRVRVGGVEFELARKDLPPAGEEDDKPTAAEGAGDPLDDPTTFGRGGYVPGLPRQKVPERR